MRISVEDKLARREKILQALSMSGGSTEAELVPLVQLERKTVNNHLRWLQDAGQVRKVGLVWYVVINRKVQIVNQIIALLNELKQELDQ